jgi:hypothetical protein
MDDVNDENYVNGSVHATPSTEQHPSSNLEAFTSDEVSPVLLLKERRPFAFVL